MQPSDFLDCFVVGDNAVRIGMGAHGQRPCLAEIEAIHSMITLNGPSIRPLQPPRRHQVLLSAVRWGYFVVDEAAMHGPFDWSIS